MMDNGVTNKSFENDLGLNQLTGSETYTKVDVNRHEAEPVSETLPAKGGKIKKFVEKNERPIRIGKIALMNLLFGAYFAWATYHIVYLKQHEYDYTDLPAPNSERYCGMQWCDGYGMLLILTIIVYIGLIFFLVFKPRYGKQVYDAVIAPIEHALGTFFKSSKMKFGLVVVGLVALALFLFFEVRETTEPLDRLRPLLGIVSLLGIGFLFSKHITKINWRPVIMGFTLQFLLGVFCIRLEVGRKAFACIGDKVATFMDYSKFGSEFVFGTYMVQEKVFAFGVLPVIFFFSFSISVLYYWGAMQWIIAKLGWILQSILGTTVCESVAAAGNIFLGMTETPLLIGPYIKHLTASEMHAIMCSGFATVSGTVLAAYISYGAEPAHLITSSVMAAPAALCFSKLFYPETEESKTRSDNLQMEKSQDSSVLDAAANGAIAGIQLIFGIIANIVAFVSFVAFLNGAFQWFGVLVGFDDLSFEVLFSKLFIPLAYVLGVPYEDCENVASVIAAKTVMNEFIAYERLGKLKLAGAISLRSSAIATYAVCGFANPGSLGVLVDGLSSVAREKRALIASVAVRAFVAGSCVCFINAAIAALLMTDDIFESMGNATTLQP